MHNERNMAEAIWNTCFDISEKTKDNAKARKDLAEMATGTGLGLHFALTRKTSQQS
jgi:hypothetical protein